MPFFYWSSLIAVQSKLIIITCATQNHNFPIDVLIAASFIVRKKRETRAHYFPTGKLTNKNFFFRRKTISTLSEQRFYYKFFIAFDFSASFDIQTERKRSLNGECTLTTRSGLQRSVSVTISLCTVLLFCPIKSRMTNFSQSRFRKVNSKMQKSSYNCQSDIKYAMRITRQIMIVLGVWPSSGEENTTYEKIVKFLLLVVSQVMLTCTLLPHVFYWLMEKETRACLRMFPSIVFGVVVLGKFGNLIFRQDQLRHCLKYLEKDWKTIGTTSAREVMLETAKIGRRLVAICVAFLYSSGMCFAAILPLTREKLYENNNTLRQLSYPAYLFSLNTHVSPVFEILFAIQSMGGMIALLVSMAACGLVIVFVMHACGQFRILMNLMQSFIEEWQDEQEIDKKLANLVDHQTRLRR